MAAEKSSKGQAWFCTTGLPSDVVIEVDDMSFHLHKFPLMSKSKKLHDLIAEQESLHVSKRRVSKAQDEEDTENEVVEYEEEEDDDAVVEPQQCHVSFPAFPGGSETFETAAKFCYGVKIELTAGKVAPLRCAGEVLEMTEEYSEDNLISKTERFFAQSVLKNVKDSIKALKSCERLSPMAENLGIVQRCIDAISSKAALYDPRLFGWPVNEASSAAAGDSRKKSANGGGGSAAKLKDSWVEDLAQLNPEFFNRVISTMKEEEINPEIIESCLIFYAKKCFPGITRSNRKPPSSSSIASEAEQRELLELIVSNLPPEKSSPSPYPPVTRYLFGLLRTANILNASESCKSTLERKIGTQLEQSTLDDLLIPSYSYLNETLYDVDCVQRILGHFLDSYDDDREIEEGEGEDDLRSPKIMLVGKLIDGYLSEIASDANLKPEKFCELALTLPEQARLYDDGLYRAVDVYLKAHPWMTEVERERISGVMDCQKLTLEACTHAAQNERLPLRAVVQVLFFEQLQLRHAIAGTLLSADPMGMDSPQPSAPATTSDHNEEDDAVERERALVVRAATPEHNNNNNNNTRNVNRSTWKEAIKENQVLRLDMDSMRSRVHELERECSTMKRVIEKINGAPPTEKIGWRSSFTRKFGCKFKTQVCDSQESTVVDARESRLRTHQRSR